MTARSTAFATASALAARATRDTLGVPDRDRQVVRVDEAIVSDVAEGTGHRSAILFLQRRPLQDLHHRSDRGGDGLVARRFTKDEARGAGPGERASVVEDEVHAPAKVIFSSQVGRLSP